MPYSNPPIGELDTAVAEISQWFDDDPANIGRTPLENLLLRTCVKLVEEVGEISGALIGLTGQNPRKGITHSMADVEKELLDVAFTALGGIEHIHGNNGTSMIRFEDHVRRLRERMLASIAEREMKLRELKEMASRQPEPGLKEFFEGVHREASTAVSENPAIYHPDGTAR